MSEPIVESDEQLDEDDSYILLYENKNPRRTNVLFFVKCIISLALFVLYLTLYLSVAPILALIIWGYFVYEYFKGASRHNMDWELTIEGLLSRLFFTLLPILVIMFIVFGLPLIMPLKKPLNFGITVLYEIFSLLFALASANFSSRYLYIVSSIIINFKKHENSASE